MVAGELGLSRGRGCQGECGIDRTVRRSRAGDHQSSPAWQQQLIHLGAEVGQVEPESYLGQACLVGIGEPVVGLGACSTASHSARAWGT